MGIQKHQKKITLLLGAGAAIPWNAPSTTKITGALKNSTDHLVGTVPLGTWINDLLENGNHGQPNNINFETYIDFIESICTHLLTTESGIRTPANLLYNVFKLRDEVIDGIANLKWTNNSSFLTDRDKVIATYYSMIRMLRNEINNYLPTYTETAFELNSKFRSFCEHFINLGFSFRSYSLNYDRSIPLIFEYSSSKHEIFDGFDILDDDGLYLLNKSRVLNDIDCNSFYNLHGSFHWEFQGTPLVIKSSKLYKYLPLNPDIADYPIHSNANEKILQSSIITGFKKTQRVNSEPNSYFFDSFFRDAQLSDIVIVVGYSYSDPHVNKLLVEAIKSEVKVYNVTLRNL